MRGEGGRKEEFHSQTELQDGVYHRENRPTTTRENKLLPEAQCQLTWTSCSCKVNHFNSFNL